MRTLIIQVAGYSRAALILRLRLAVVFWGWKRGLVTKRCVGVIPDVTDTTFRRRGYFCRNSVCVLEQGRNRSILCAIRHHQSAKRARQRFTLWMKTAIRGASRSAARRACSERFTCRGQTRTFSLLPMQRGIAVYGTIPFSELGRAIRESYINCFSLTK
jgi:hypothetical protein